MSVDPAVTLESRLAALEADLEELRELVHGMNAMQAQLIRDSARYAREHEAARGDGAADASALHQLELRLAQKEEEAQRLSEEVAALKQARDDALGELSLLRQGWKALDARLRKLESAAPAMMPPLPGAPAAASAAGTPPPAPAAAAPPPTAARPARSTPARPAAATSPRPEPASAVEGHTIIHVDDLPAYREVVQAAAVRRSVQYLGGEEAFSKPPQGRAFLTLNLAYDKRDPLGVIAGAAMWGIRPPQALAYCTAEGSRGVVFGFVDFFPPPFHASECARRLLRRPEGVQRLLVVSEDVEPMNALKNDVTGLGCALSMAFDARQALDLVPMVRPDLVLIDLNLPKGQGLHVAARLRVDARLPRLGFAFLWTTPIDPVEFRQHAVRAVRDIPISPDDLNRSVVRALGPAGPLPFDRA